MILLSRLRKFDWFLMGSVLFLSLIGLLEIYNICLHHGSFLNFQKQLIFIVLGLFLIFLFSFFDYRILKTNSYLVLGLYVLILIFLIGLFFFGSEINGVKGWYNFGLFSFDPVPFLSIILIIVLSKYFSRYHVEIYKFKHIFFSGIFVLIPSIIIFFQPDFGSVLMLIFIWVGIVIFSEVKISHFLILVLIFCLISLFLWGFALRDYQKQRIVTFLNPEVGQTGASWNINQSKIAIGSGGLFGKGIGNGSQAQYGEETGFLGISILLSVFLFLIFRIIKIALISKNNFARLFASGFAFLLFSQAFINIGMSLGVLPVIGIPLPFVSYGGSQLIAFYLGLGILQNIKIHST